MQRIFVNAARALLALSAVVIALGVAQVGVNLEVSSRPDRLGHALIAFVVTVLLFVSAPATPVWILATAPIVLGAVLELSQATILVPGSVEWGDFVADVLGVLAAVAPLMAGRIRSACQPTCQALADRA